MNNAWGLITLATFCATICTKVNATPQPETHLCQALNNSLQWQPLAGLDFNKIDIKADDVELIGAQTAKFSGDVNINTMQMRLSATAAFIDKESGILNAKGPIEFQNNTSLISSSGLSANLSDYQITLDDAAYQLTKQLGRGGANKLSVNQTKLTLQGASFTACPENNEIWSIHAEDIVLSQEEGWAETYNTVFKILDVPVFYLPYFTLPIDDQRKSGFIAPNLGPSSRYGFEIATPYYWNISPNTDATITPRLLTNIGFQLQTEFRYLTEKHHGLVALEFLDKDKSEPDLNERYLFHWQQKSQLNDNWRGSIDITNISDDNYLTDLDSDYANKTDTQLYRTGLLSHFGHRWQTDIKIQNFEVLGDHSPSYSALPQISFNQFAPFYWQNIEFTINGELSHFKNNELKITDASRFHIEPKAQFIYEDFAWSFLSELSLLHTQYKQSGDFSGSEIEKSVSRTMPKIRLHGQLNLERETQWLIKDGIQTLEPQLQYLYVPKKDQTNIGLYDTTKLQDDFFGLFRDRRFSGVDRIASANQFTLGVTTRLFSQNNEELFNLSVGQIFYLSDSAKPTEQDLTSNTNYNALFAGEAMLHWHRRWYLGAGIQYDTDGQDLIQSHMTLDYKGDDNQLVQLNHRYTNNVSNNKIEQVGLFASVPINQNWQFIGSYQRDLETGRSVEILSGLQYESCCWAVQITGHRQIETNLNQSLSGLGGQEAAFDSGIRLSFIKGLNASKLLQQSIFGYRRPYFINN